MSSSPASSDHDAHVGAQGQEFVYVCIQEPAPESIPRPRRIEAVLADKEAAERWQRSGPPVTLNSPLRIVEKHEVVR